MQSQTGARQHSHHPPQPHLFQRAGHSDYSTRAPRGESPILPQWDPFAIPANRLQDSVAPVLRFMLLVAVFTVAGTTVLTIGKRAQTASEQPAQTTTAVKQTLEPETAADGATKLSNEQPAGPTVFGPLAAPATDDLETSSAALPTASANAITSPLEQPDSPETHTSRDTVETPIDSGTPVIEDPLPPLTHMDGSPLPQVRISDPPRAVARLPGYIEEITTRQAKNDDDESSVY